ncbi:MAG: 2-oxo acid dehydrogenase subunit E2, partial [Okeania sp. SIO4D6]|nr:2-oxo acid dehydrogenase subunit E2 [Okeania sp. SIO4D6]
MINEVFMPALSSTMTEGKIVSWQKSTGDWVEKGETVVVVESDKADMDVESFFSGYLANIIVEAGDVAAVGSTIALLAETEAEIETAKQQGGATTKQETAPAASTAATAVATAPSSVTTETKENNGRRNGRIIASPRARKLAKKLKVDLSTLKGTGPHGRIVAEDVEMATGSTPTSVAASAKTATPVIPTQPSIPTAPPPPSAPPTPITPGQVVKMNTLQNAVVRNMMVSLSVPTLHVGYTIATDNLDGLYKQIKSKGVTMTAMLAKAIAMTLQQHP